MSTYDSTATYGSALYGSLIVILSDNGKGTDLAKGGLRVPLPSDAGHGTETFIEAATLVKVPGDSGHGSDLIPYQEEAFGDAGHGAETLLTKYKIFVPESAVAADLLGLIENPGTIHVTLVLPDEGSGIQENTFIKAIIRNSDSVHGTDIQALKARIPVLDTGHGSEFLVSEVFVSTFDSANGNDIISFLKIIVKQTVDEHGNDVGTGTDIVNIPKISFALADSGHGTDTLAFVIQAILIRVTDSAKGTDIVNNLLAGTKVFIPNRKLILSILKDAKQALTSPPIKLGSSTIPRPGRPYINPIIKLTLNFNLSLNGSPLTDTNIAFLKIKVATDGYGNASVPFIYNAPQVTITVTITNANGNIVSGAQVTLNTVTKTTDSNGQVTYTIYSSGVIQ
jgi:hypothetical protein